MVYFSKFEKNFVNNNDQNYARNVKNLSDVKVMKTMNITWLRLWMICILLLSIIILLLNMSD